MLQNYIQSVRTNQVTYYDYGPEGNLQAYGSEQPTRLPIEDINVDLVLMFAEFDSAVTPEDANWFRERVQQVTLEDITYQG